MNKIDYVGQIIGTRKIIKNCCSDTDWLDNGLKIPQNKQDYVLGQCLVCGKQMPCVVKILKRNPPKKCAYCTGIGYKGNQDLGRNFYEEYDKYTVINILYKDTMLPCYIDSEDIERVKQYVWRISKKKNKYYAVTGNKRTGYFYLHNFLLNYTYNYQTQKEVDHINGNSLDNRKDNLRIVTRLQNIQNVSVRIDNQIGIRGITKTNSNRYQVDFIFNKQRFYFKYWDTLEEAILCRKIAEEYFGLQILAHNPLCPNDFNLPIEVQQQIYQYVISILNQ